MNGAVHESFLPKISTVGFVDMLDHPTAVRPAPSWSTPTAAQGHTSNRAPKPWFVNVCVALAGLGLGIVLGLVAINETSGTLAAPGGWFTASGRLTGFVSAYLMCLLVVVMTRIPWLERSVGQDRLVAWHRRIGPWTIWMVIAHVVLITIGYAALNGQGLWRQVWTFITQYPDMLQAFVAFGLLVMVGVSSIKRARRKLRYETWWVAHLYVYLALGLAIAHQLRTGAAFVNHPLVSQVWLALWIATGLSALAFRVGGPVLQNLRHQLKVSSVEEVASGVYAITCEGRRLSSLQVAGGQFFQWRFLTRELWWHAHPYSISAVPRPPHLRVTVKGLGDQSRLVAHLRPGTRVLIEGPYGAFTHHASTCDQVVLIGAGVGLTPIRAILDDLPNDKAVTVVVRARSLDDVPHRDELTALAAHRGARYVELTGTRDLAPMDADHLGALLPGVTASDVYICGPEGFTDAMLAAMGELGVPPAQLHAERFSF